MFDQSSWSSGVALLLPVLVPRAVLPRPPLRRRGERVERRRLRQRQRRPRARPPQVEGVDARATHRRPPVVPVDCKKAKDIESDRQTSFCEYYSGPCQGRSGGEFKRGFGSGKIEGGTVQSLQCTYTKCRVGGTDGQRLCLLTFEYHEISTKPWVGLKVFSRMLNPM